MIGRAAEDPTSSPTAIEPERLTAGSSRLITERDVAVGLFVLLELEAAELPAEVGERRTLPTRGQRDLARKTE